MRKQPLFQAGEKDGVELQPFCAVKSHHNSSGIRVVTIQLRRKGRTIQKLEDRFPSLLRLGRSAGKLRDIGHATFGFYRRLVLFKHSTIVDILHNLLEQFGQTSAVSPGHPEFEHLNETAERARRPDRYCLVPSELLQHMKNRGLSLDRS